MKRVINFAVLFLAVACTTAPATAPQPQRDYGLAVIRDLAEYRRLVAEDPDKQLIDVSTLGIATDVRYATDANFMKKKLYPVAKVYLRAPAARALAAANAELQKTGRTLKVFDGYRPYRVTVEMWEKIGNPDYVADPAKGSRHNRGAAVDVTMTYTNPSSILRMGTGYDDFSVRASHEYTNFHPEILENRRVLRELMAKHGFDAFTSEWWHYDFRGWEKYELMDLDLSDLAQVQIHPER